MGIWVPLGHRPGVALGGRLRGQIIAKPSSFGNLINWLLLQCFFMPNQVSSMSTESTREQYHCFIALGLYWIVLGLHQTSPENGTQLGALPRHLKQVSPVTPWGVWYKRLTFPPQPFCEVLCKLNLKVSCFPRVCPSNPSYPFKFLTFLLNA